MAVVGGCPCHWVVAYVHRGVQGVTRGFGTARETLFEFLGPPYLPYKALKLIRKTALRPGP
eukprot:scaffold303415_cov22-Tisochrysis_lutea.AAC.1